MNTLCTLYSHRVISFLPKLDIMSLNSQKISTTCTSHLKQIITEEKGNSIVISGKIIDSERKPFHLKCENGVCPLCATGLNVKHTDVLILSQFVRSDGCMLPRRVTGLCTKQQRRVSSLVTMAHKAGLMPNLNPDKSKKDPQQRFEWKKFNKYFDETTIKT
ncbi:28S ribosomal protein S18a, mitochondrial [Coccinella septempunctata]|uniref:28S ribosomal protein S18a, mitochondrial n=1 Tax=Coccinella septempunctata TaxID=41139 RepID=UPI001D07AFBA|nr:28S ribosomal protein S18a, mitochondrial [Coccinella septempunctata]